ncbi:MAG: Asp-tRNA(Asn)/Glu-tRNA(Gln) amidotransferase GatCAB subunit B [Phycisphaerae bacterium]|nr:Asp-tRNA(Asn)/Glu-tRNA(Gln) amidotransferase GatCAB subunit B [Phycisphaerae bacterium]
MAEIVSTQLKIGMEIHVELATRSKMFTRSAGAAFPDHYDADPNTLCDPLVLALPGSLPVLNHAAIDMSMMVGMALGCRIASFTKWDRKNYFYPDLPKGYQISQYDQPLCLEGSIDIPSADGGVLTVGITRAHLEEDTGKTGHELPGGKPYAGSLVDYNRAGTPLLEIVTEPDFSCAEDCVTFGRELRNICRFLGVTEGIMQRGHMRFEPNVNVLIELDDGRQIATPVVEVKNLNSFRAVLGAIQHEEKRQVEAWKEDGREMGPGMKATRGWDDQQNITLLQREKEDAHDYRYFPDPDLLPVVIDDVWRDRIREQLPELPMQRRARYRETFGLSEKDASAITDDRDLCFFFEACAARAAEVATEMKPGEASAQAAKWLLNAGARVAREREVAIEELGVTPDQLAGIIALRATNAVGSTAADELFVLLCDHDGSAEELAESRGLMQVSDSGQLDSWIDEAIAAHPQAAEDFGAGKDAAMGRIMGHIMKASGGKADANMIRQSLIERLRS